MKRKKHLLRPIIAGFCGSKSPLLSVSSKPAALPRLRPRQTFVGIIKTGWLAAGMAGANLCRTWPWNSYVLRRGRLVKQNQCINMQTIVIARSEATKQSSKSKAWIASLRSQ